MLEWLIANKVPLGLWIKRFVDFINEHAAGASEALSQGLAYLINGLIALLEWFNPLVLVVLIAALAYWLHRSVKLVVFIVLSLLLIINLGYWEATLETLALVICATIVSMLIGIPLGIAAAHRPWLFTILRPILDLMQTIPTFVYLIPTLILFGLGVVPGLISTVIFAIPAPIRLTHLGITSVPKALIEAGEAFGATKRQLLWKVELPYAMPTIMEGVTLVGANGLGKPVVRALNTVNIAQGFEAGLAIVIIAIVLDRVCKRPGAVPK